MKNKTSPHACSLFTLVPTPVVLEKYSYAGCPPKCYCLAIFIGLIFPVFQSPQLVILCAALAALLIFPELLVTRSIFCLCLCLALLVSNQRIEYLSNLQISADLEGKSIRVYGEVQSPVQSDGLYKRFILKVKNAELLNKTKSADGIYTRQDNLPTLVNLNIRLSWKTERALAENSCMKAIVRLKRPRGLANIYGFDYQAWLLSKGISATGYVKQRIPENISGSDCYHAELLFSNSSFVYRLRQSIARKLTEATRQFTYGNIVRALVTGDASDVPASYWALFQNTGTIHLMAISGLHIGLVTGFSALFLLILLRPLSLLCKPEMLRLCIVLGSSSCALFYAYIAGFSVPTRRAVLMVLFFNLAFLLGRKTSVLQLLLVVACLIVVSNPFVVTQPGFILSFFSVFLLIYTLSQRIPVATKLYVFLKAQLVMGLGLIPFLALLDLPYAMLSPLANAVAVPMMSFVVLPLIFIAILVLFLSSATAHLILSIVDVLIASLLSILRYVDDVSHLLVLPHHSSTYILATGCVGILMFFLPRGLSLRIAGFVLFSSFLASSLTKSRENQLSVLDVGQGLSIVLNLGEKTLVYDVGARYSDAFDMVTAAVLPYLKARGLARIHALIISHADNDHAGAHEKLFKEIPIEHHFSGEFERLKAGSQRSETWTAANRCHRGQSILSSAYVDSDNHDFSIEVLWPPNSELASHAQKYKKIRSANDYSCVVLIRVDDYTILLTGDVSKRVEAELIRSGSLPKRLDLLIAPHHGSRSSSSQAFISHLSPRHVVFSAGYKNRYRHPSTLVVDRYRRHGTQIWYTAYHGGLVFHLPPNKESVETVRCDHRKRWYANEGFCE